MFTPSTHLLDAANSLGLKLMAAPPFAMPSDISSTLFEREYVMANGKMRRDAEFRAGRLAAENSLLQIEIRGDVGVAKDRSPVWPEFAVGSISHSDVFVWAVAGRSWDLVSVGVDTEPVADENTLRHLHDEILSLEEKQLLMQLGIDERTAFTLIFSAKESFYKCVYQIEPVFFGFQDVKVKSANDETLLLELTPDCPQELRQITPISVEYIVCDGNVFTACWLRSKE